MTEFNPILIRSLRKIAINKVHFPITTLGYGRRVGIWTQGCSIRCPKCVSRDTWEFDRTKDIPVKTLIESLSGWLSEADGVTISGGEPFDQPQALIELLDALRERSHGDILMFTGYPYERVSVQWRNVLSQLDVLITDPYRPEAGTSLVLRGSDNQRIFLLTELARERYPSDLDRQAWPEERRMDVFLERDKIWMAGIPRSDEMERLKKLLAVQGLTCQTSEEIRAQLLP